MLLHPVPPTFTASVDDADQLPPSIVATPVKPDESIPVPPRVLGTVPRRFERERQTEEIEKQPDVVS